MMQMQGTWYICTIELYQLITEILELNTPIIITVAHNFIALEPYTLQHVPYLHYTFKHYGIMTTTYK